MTYGLTDHAEILICLKRKSHKLRQAAELCSKVHTCYLTHFRLKFSPFDFKKKKKTSRVIL